MLRVPSNPQVIVDPTRFITEMKVFDVYSYVKVTDLDTLAAQLYDNKVYSWNTPAATEGNIYRTDLSQANHNPLNGELNDIQLTPVTLEEVYQADPYTTFIDADSNVILPLLNGTRNHYYKVSGRDLALRTCFASIYQYIKTYSYINHKGYEPSPYEYFYQEQIHLPEFDTMLGIITSELLEVVERFVLETPEKVIELNLINNCIRIHKLCDYRTWLHQERENDNQLYNT